MVAFEGRGSDVGLVVARTIAGVSHQTGKLLLGVVQLVTQTLGEAIEVTAHLGELAGSPRLLTLLDRQLLLG